MPERRNDMLTIRTPEGIAFSIPLSGPLRRFLAWAIDFFTITVAAGVAGSFLRLLLILTPDLALGATVLLYFVLSIGYPMLSEWLWRGQTLGKFLLSIRVMDVQGLRLQFSQLAIRNLLRFVDQLPAFYLVAGVAMMLTRCSQRLGDLAANTVVVLNRQPDQPDFDQVMPDKYNSLRDYPHLEARLRQRVSPAEAALLVQALLRREEYEPSARVALYAEIARHFREMAVFPESATAGITDEQYLRNVVDSVFRKKGTAAT